MANKLIIPKQDKRQPETITVTLPAHIVERLKHYAGENEHDVDYVVSHVLDEMLPPEEARKAIPQTAVTTKAAGRATQTKEATA